MTNEEIGQMVHDLHGMVMSGQILRFRMGFDDTSMHYAKHGWFCHVWTPDGGLSQVAPGSIGECIAFLASVAPPLNGVKQ